MQHRFFNPITGQEFVVPEHEHMLQTSLGRTFLGYAPEPVKPPLKKPRPVKEKPDAVVRRNAGD